MCRYVSLMRLSEHYEALGMRGLAGWYADRAREQLALR